MAITEKIAFDETPVSKPVEKEAEEAIVELPEDPPRVAPKSTPLEAEVRVANEVNTDPEVPRGTVKVTIAGVQVRVLPMDQWFSSANEHLQYMRMNLWAQDALYEPDLPLWMGINGGRGPRNGEVDKMFIEYGAKTGQSVPGK